MTEASACGTPVVATAIAGHGDSVISGVTGLLVDGRREPFADALHSVLADADLRRRLGAGGLQFASELTWDATALGTFEVLAQDARARRRSSDPTA